ncbi:MAG: hypothetical protein K1060chlam5_00937 [Candidatus Anoxychlamydiales bacterium]|nr:hypothetical protein [Candidatus Anoxychlamydiales bacterium]
MRIKIEGVDLVCIGAKEANLKILKGMGGNLKKTKYIITKSEVISTYEEEPLLPEVIIFFK